MNSSFMIPIPYNYTSTVDTFLKRDLRGGELGESICWDGVGVEGGGGWGREQTPKEGCVGGEGREGRDEGKIPDFV